MPARCRAMQPHTCALHNNADAPAIEQDGRAVGSCTCGISYVVPSVSQQGSASLAALPHTVIRPNCVAASPSPLQDTLLHIFQNQVAVMH